MVPIAPQDIPTLLPSAVNGESITGETVNQGPLGFRLPQEHQDWPTNLIGTTS